MAVAEASEIGTADGIVAQLLWMGAEAKEEEEGERGRGRTGGGGEGGRVAVAERRAEAG